jgi:hypothetical protein
MDLLPASVPGGCEQPSTWHADRLTQGNEGPVLVRDALAPAPATATAEKRPPPPPKDETVHLLDALAAMIDPLFKMYPYETKRDIRQHLKETIVDWVAKHARTFFGPSTSRSISVCIRGHSNITMADVERAAELVSFFMEVPVRVGEKTVVWHGYGDGSREPALSLITKQQGVFVRYIKK